jgi:hypothetical protein
MFGIARETEAAQIWQLAHDWRRTGRSVPRSQVATPGSENSAAGLAVALLNCERAK